MSEFLVSRSELKGKDVKKYNREKEVVLIQVGVSKGNKKGTKRKMKLV